MDWPEELLEIFDDPLVGGRASETEGADAR